jgi:hypothetical protein
MNCGHESRIQRVPPQGACRRSGLAYSLNGTGDRPRLRVSLLERLTRVDRLDLLTALPWAKAISCVHLLRTQRAWYPFRYVVENLAGPVRIAQIVGELLAASPRLSAAFRLDIFQENLRILVRGYGQYSSRIPIRFRDVREWIPFGKPCMPLSISKRLPHAWATEAPSLC